MAPGEDAGGHLLWADYHGIFASCAVPTSYRIHGLGENYLNSILMLFRVVDHTFRNSAINNGGLSSYHSVSHIDIDKHLSVIYFAV